MEDAHRAVKIVEDHFQLPNHSGENSPSNRENTSQSTASSSSQQLCAKPFVKSRSCNWSGRKQRRFSLMLNLFSLPKMPWSSSADEEEKVEIDSVELNSLRAELADLEEREAYLKAQLEHVDEILRSAHLAGYLFIRTRWPALPGEPPPLDDSEVDDWLPRFVVLHGSCVFIYMICTDLSPQDSTLLSDITGLDVLPSFAREDGEMRYAFFIQTRRGLRYECCSSSKLQVDSWLATMQLHCKESKLENS